MDLSNLTGTAAQWAQFGALLTTIMGGITVWIKGMPERGRVATEKANVTAKIEGDLLGEAAERFREFREEVFVI